MGHLAPLRRAWLFKDLRNLQLSPSKPIYAGSRYSIRYSPAKHSFPATPCPPCGPTPVHRVLSSAQNFAAKGECADARKSVQHPAGHLVSIINR